MALETDRSSPSSASSPGPTASTRPGSESSSPANSSASPDSCRSLCCNGNSPVLNTPSASRGTPHVAHHTPPPPPPSLPTNHQEPPCQCCGPVSPPAYADNTVQSKPTACRPRSPKSTPSSPSHNNHSLCNLSFSASSPSELHNQPLKPLPSSPSNASRNSFSSPSPQSPLPPSPSHNRHPQASPPEHQQGSSPGGPSPRPPNNETVPQPTTLPFSVANILRPDFGRRAVITCKQQEPLFRPGGIRRTVTPICDYQRLYRPHEHLPGVQPLPAPKPTKKQTSAWSPVTTARSPTVPTEDVSFKVSGRESNHQQARSKGVSPPVPTPATVSPPLSPASSTVSATSSNPDDKVATPECVKGPQLWPAWVYCTRYSDRPSSGKLCASVCLRCACVFMHSAVGLTPRSMTQLGHN
jgi:hypothetical protein